MKEGEGSYQPVIDYFYYPIFYLYLTRYPVGGGCLSGYLFPHVEARKIKNNFS